MTRKVLPPIHPGEIRYDIEMEKDLLADRLDREVRPRVAPQQAGYKIGLNLMWIALPQWREGK
jgi:hypothetical protein